MKHLSIIIILILMGGLLIGGSWGYYFGLKRASDMWIDTLVRSIPMLPFPLNPNERTIILSPEQRAALPYLIDNMEHARKTHQDIVDDPARFGNWVRAGVDHQVWVDIYEETIEILEVLE